MLLSAYNPSFILGYQYKNNNLISSTSAVLTRTGLIYYLFTYNGSLKSECFGQEIIIYAIDNSSNLSAINTNINSFYSIY